MVRLELVDDARRRHASSIAAERPHGPQPWEHQEGRLQLPTSLRRCAQCCNSRAPSPSCWHLPQPAQLASFQRKRYLTPSLRLPESGSPARLWPFALALPEPLSRFRKPTTALLLPPCRSRVRSPPGLH